MSEITFNDVANKVAEGSSVLSDASSVLRNTGSAASEFGGRVASAFIGAIPIMAAAGGALAFVAGANLIRVGATECATDIGKKNLEGVGVHAATATIGASLSTVGAGLVLDTAVNTAAGITAITFGGFALYGILGIKSIHGLHICYKFRDELDQKENDSEKIKWLKRQVEDPATARQFELRTSLECREMIERLDLEELDDSQVTNILTEVERANSKALMKHWILTAIAILGIVTFVGMITFATGGAIVPLLFAIGAIAWFSIDSSWLHKTLGDWIYGESKISAWQTSIADIAETERLLPSTLPSNGIDRLR